MENINSCTFSGHATKDAEFKAFQSGATVLNFAIAVNTRKKDADGNWSDSAAFIHCKLFGSRAQALAPVIVRGAYVVVSGRLDQEEWTDKASGERRSRLVLLVSSVEVTRKDDGAGAKQPATRPPAGGYAASFAEYQQQHAAQKANGYAPETPKLDAYAAEDIPF